MAQTIQKSLAHGKGTTSDGHQIEYVDTVEAYNKWAEVYDTDGNFLQALDTIEMRDLLPRFLARVQSQSQTESADNTLAPLNLVDLGCGTGRNTLQLAKCAPSEARIIGLDASPGMLEVATTTLQEQRARARASLPSPSAGRATLLGVYDLLSASSSSQPLPAPLQMQLASGIISTLVLEHIPVDMFFEGAARLIKPGGYFLVTNMHAEMGGISQAGFVDVKTGTKIRPTSYAHEVEDVVDAAERVGFEVVGLGDGEGERVRERRVDAAMVEGLGERGRKWVGVLVWFGVCFRMRSG
ncbi:S-adenosyl-L-methionine-dependent methyltransferase [Aspergillus cavernicola]|uniref:S-adenosyl-L-methionine-dependent methyltransferase n=1 Tax=Aspergillus cavernicola TaxID=176166 RepID=A0ABR4IIR6_9EURO